MSPFRRLSEDPELAGQVSGRGSTAHSDRVKVEGEKASTGVEGLDTVLGGGLQRHHTFLVEGIPGAGKTTLALQFCMAGARAGERVLYITTSESAEEIRAVARGHLWSLEGVDVHYHTSLEGESYEPSQSVFHPTEVDLPRTMQDLLAIIDRTGPQRLVIDSLSEIRLLAGEPLWYRREIMMLKEELAGRKCTTLLCDRPNDPGGAVQTIAHGVINLEFHTPDYGPDRRRLRISKLRGQAYASGFHDFKIRTGGIELYPRLVAGEHRGPPADGTISSGIPELDDLFLGGADRGTATLLYGPSGTGKSTVACQYVLEAARRGERSAMYLFDERVQTLLKRAASLRMNLEEFVRRGLISIDQVDPAELTPGEFGNRLYHDITDRDVKLVVIDSLAGYFHAMPDERLLSLHLHELLSYLSQSGVSTLLVMTQHGLPGTPHYTPIDLSYVADSVLLFHMYEYRGELRKSLSLYKRRSGPHSPSIRQLRFGERGIEIGPVLREFRGILTGVPTAEEVQSHGNESG